MNVHDFLLGNFDICRFFGSKNLSHLLIMKGVYEIMFDIYLSRNFKLMIFI